MKRPPLTKQIILGLLLGLLLFPAQPAQAQWTVYDPANHATQIEKMIKEAARWLEQVDHYRKQIEHYGKMFDKAVEQVTTLGGILTQADKLVANNNNIISSMSSLGRTVRGVFTLRRNLQHLVVTRIEALKRIDDRLRTGIFDPQADLIDLEEYLKTSIGRSSQDRIATLERMANMDALLERWYRELKQSKKNRADLERELIENDRLLQEELSKPENMRSQTTILRLSQHADELNGQILQVDAEIKRLTDLIEQRLKRYNMVFVERGDFAKDVEAMEQAWDSFFSVKEDLIRDLEQYNGATRRRPTE